MDDSKLIIKKRQRISASVLNVKKVIASKNGSFSRRGGTPCHFISYISLCTLLVTLCHLFLFISPDEDNSEDETKVLIPVYHIVSNDAFRNLRKMDCLRHTDHRDAMVTLLDQMLASMNELCPHPVVVKQLLQYAARMKSIIET